jgi:arabinofuranan 3-O-arabinosyltransferase
LLSDPRALPRVHVGDFVVDRPVADASEPRPWRERVRAAARTHRIGLAGAGAAAFSGAAVALLWFRVGEFVARGDVGPWVRDGLRGELGWQWTHQNTGAGGPTYLIVRAPDVLMVEVARFLGGSDALAQRLWFALLFAFAAAGTAAFVGTLCRRPSVVFAAGVLGAFNPLVMVNLPNYLLPLAIGTVGTVAALAVEAARGPRGRVLLGALVTLACSYLALNPPMLVLTVAWFACAPAVAALLTGTGRAGCRRAFGWLGRVAGWAVPLALWWLVPYVTALAHARAAGTFGAETDVAAWSWSHAHGTLDRVLTLTAKWSWPDARYGAHASFLANSQWSWVAWALPVGAFLAPLTARPRHRRAACWLVLAVAGVAVVAKGLNPPFAGVNEWAYAHVPGMWLLREPVTKLGPFLVLVLVGAWAIALDGAAPRLRFARRRASTDVRARRLVDVSAALIAAVALGPVLFALPMITGRALGGEERVSVPDAWRDVAAVVNASHREGKALVLPVDDFYQVPTTWGYYGTDTLVRQLIERPVIVRNPQNYISDTVQYDALVRGAEDAIAGGDAAAAANLLRVLGVSHVLVRTDIDFESTVRPPNMTRPDALLAGLDAVEGLRRVEATDVATVFETTRDVEPVQALASTVTPDTDSTRAVAAIIGSVPFDVAVTTDPRVASDGEAFYVPGDGPREIASVADGTWTVTRRSGGPPVMSFSAEGERLVLRDGIRTTVDGRELPSRPPVSLTAPGPVIAATLGEQVVDLSSGPVLQRVAPRAVVVPYAHGSGSGLGSWSDLRDCHRYDARTSSEVGLFVQTSDGAGGPTVELRAEDHAACVFAPVTGVRSGDLLRLGAEARSLSGAPARLCVWLVGPERCTSTLVFRESPREWTRRDELVRVPPGVTGVRVYLYADGPPDGTSRTNTVYRRIEVERLAAGEVREVSVSAPPVEVVRHDAGPTTASVRVDAPLPRLGERSPVDDCRRADGRTLDEAGIAARSIAGSGAAAVRLTAAAHTACVSYAVTRLHPTVAYAIAADVDAQGASPRVCLWQEPANRCARLELTREPSHGTTGVYEWRTRAEAGTRTARLYLYADGTAAGTRIDYRDVDIRPVSAQGVVLMPLSARMSEPPRATTTQVSPAEYRVRLEGADGPFVVALSESYAGGWRLRGLPEGARARHVELDGYRNGWLVDATGDLDLTLEYAPAARARVAMGVSTVAGIALALAFVGVPFARRWRRRSIEALRRECAARPGGRSVPIDVLVGSTPAPGTVLPPAGS